MKTTVELPDPLLREAKLYAAQRGIPLRAVFARALETLLKGRAAPRRRFRLKTVTTKGEGLAIDGDWSEVRSLIYEGHGG